MADEEDTFPTRVEKRLAPFDPEGSGFDEATASRLRKERPLTLTKPMTKPAGPVPDEFNKEAFGRPEAWEAWVWHPEENDWVVHGSSFDPDTRRLLKGMKHSSINRTFEEEEKLGNEIVKREDGYYYSQPKNNK